MLQEIYDGYKAHAAKEAKEERLIALHQKRLRKLENKGGWCNLVLKPLAQKISEALGGMPYEIYGPFGLGAETSVYFFPSGVIGDITKAENYGITLHPHFREGEGSPEERFYLSYNTGERRNDYPRGSIGWLNGFNNVEAPLPDDLDTIVEIVRSHHLHYRPEEEEK